MSMNVLPVAATPATITVVIAELDPAIQLSAKRWPPGSSPGVTVEGGVPAKQEPPLKREVNR
jgi:hypothetical protein